ncbi:hypothetical protein [Nocardioides lentus]|uniref:hypothetical protein n=1 Tax=Nocardioides lentus TaxID=338077 RepID=UPI0031DBE31F
MKALLDAGDLTRRPQPRDRGTPSVSAASVARMVPLLAQQARQAEARSDNKPSASKA